MEPIYYFVPTKDLVFETGSIFKYEKGELIDSDSNIEVINKEGNDWIAIPKEEANWLMKRNILERAKLQQTAVFQIISDLKRGDKCFHRTENGDILCTIVECTKKPGVIKFKIKLEDNIEKEVLSDYIELCNPASEHSQSLEEIIKLLMEHKCDIQKIDRKKQSVLSLAYLLQNKAYFKMFITSNTVALDIGRDNIQSLLRSIVKDQSWGLLELVLSKCDIQPMNNGFLIELAIAALKDGKNELLGVILKFARGIQILDNGETFLTNLFKENINATIIKRVIEMKLFDVNAHNNDKETPLTLACKRILVDVVNTLLAHGANPKFESFKPTKAIVEASNQYPDKQDDCTAIMEALSRIQTNDPATNRLIDPKSLPTQPHTDVPLSGLDQQILEIMKLLFLNGGDIVVLNKENKSVLTLSYNLPNRRLFNIFVHNHQGKLDILSNATGQQLLKRMVTDREMSTLTVVLDKCVLNDAYEVFLLNLAMQTLQSEMQHHYKMIAVKCVDTNKAIGNEVFLTNCFKINVKEKLLSDVVMSKCFDINKCNASQETPLILACERLMGACVKLLLSNGADISYRDYYAIEVVVAKGNLPDNAANRKAAKILIFDLISGKNREVKEKLQVMDNGFVKITENTTVKPIALDFRIGDPVITHDKLQGPLNGELKWLGLIDNENCAGIQLDNAQPYGSDGKINDTITFECTAGHGVVTTIANVTLDHGALKLHCLASNIIDPDKYLRVEKMPEEDLNKMDIKIDGKVYAILLTKNQKEQKTKATLKWLGIMNGVLCGVVELDDNNNVNGTNGRFWRHQLVNCADKRAVALRKEHIVQYLPFKTLEIPLEKRTFPKIMNNSRVIFYHQDAVGLIKKYYGTVKWSGVNLENEYHYGIELDECIAFGHDGEISDIRLFHCERQRGIVTPICNVAPEVEEIDDTTVPPSEDSNTVQYCIPMSRFIGKRYGVQGNNHSSFLDSLIFGLFSNTDALDFIINANVNDLETNQLIKQMRNILSWKVVFPLREFGFVSFHKLKELRDVISQFGPQYKRIIDSETDLNTLEPLLMKLCPDESLLKLITLPDQKSTSMFIRLSPKPKGFTSCQQLIDISMVVNNTMFGQMPTCLIIDIPLESKNANADKCILPSKTIEISSLCLNHFKKCSVSKCTAVAIYRCKACVEKEKSIKLSLFCAKHKCHHKKSARLDKCEFGSQSEVSMFLKTIICKRNNHYVAYVKGNDSKKDWIYFDSGIENNPPDPEIVSIEVLEPFLRMDMKDMIQDLEANPSELLSRIVNDSCVFVYLNESLMCY